MSRKIKGHHLKNYIEKLKNTGGEEKENPQTREIISSVAIIIPKEVDERGSLSWPWGKAAVRKYGGLG